MAKAPKAQDAGDTAIVKALADILDEAGLAELEFENGNMSVRLSRVAGSAAPVAAVAPAAAAPVPPVAGERGGGRATALFALLKGCARVRRGLRKRWVGL